MASSRGFSDIVNSMIERLKVSQPNLDTKPGSVSRDLFIDLPADQIARFYNVLNIISQKQSLSTSAGQDLDFLASNFGIGRKTGSPASGFIVVCINELSADIPIPTGTTATSRNGLTFKTLGNYSMSVGEKGRLAANATRLRKALNLAGITANYVIEIPVECTRIGTSGNISSSQIVTFDTQLNGLSVTNLTPFTGGQNREGDDSFRARVLSIFSGANIGTNEGYRSAALAVTSVQDAIVVEPGSSLMLRDGTETIATTDGGTRILNSGNGGKVDIYILGTKTEAVSESYIFTDLSGKGDPTRVENDHILGQQNQDLSRTIEERRVLSLKNGTLPLQPATNIISITGSKSGELSQKYIDNNGNIAGNFELIKDTSDSTGGSPFGFDKIHYISGSKKVTGESITKGGANSIDGFSFSDISDISSVYVDISEINEASVVSKTSKNIINLLHKPVVRVNRVQNLTTGEVYVVLNQNFDENTGLNLTGQITISGRQLPSPSDSLSVNYSWRKYFNPAVDYAGYNNISVYKTSDSTDVIDWTTSSGISKEESTILLSDDSLEYQVELTNNISSIISVWTEFTTNSTVSTITISGVDSYGVDLSSLGTNIDNVISIKRSTDGLELYNTTSNNGKIIGSNIILPNDSNAKNGDSVIVYYNKIELYNYENTDGSFANNIITLPTEQSRISQDINDVINEIYSNQSTIYVSYVAKIENLISQTDLLNLPIQGLSSTNTLIGIGGTLNIARQPIDFNFIGSTASSTIRYSPSQIRLLASNISNPGRIKIQGTSYNPYTLKVSGININGMILDIYNSLSEAIGASTIGSSYGIAKVDKMYYISGGIKKELEIHGYGLQNNLYDKNRCSLDQSLSLTQISIPSHSQNPSSFNSGDYVEVVCQIFNTNEQEDVFFRTSGERFTRNVFGRINSISILSGFKNTSGILKGSIEIDLYNQPISFTNYYTDYSFIAPKNGERLQISYNLNKLITDVTQAIELARPITADVLVKEAFQILIDVSGTILINEDFSTEVEIIEQNVITAISGLLSTGVLGSRIDYSDIASVASSVRGVDSVNISLFNKSGETGRKAFIYALENQTIVPGTITITAVSREKFRIN